MGKMIKYLTAVLVFIVVNLYTGILIFDQWEEFRLMNSPVSIKPLVEERYEFIDTVDIDNDGEKEVILRDSRYSNYNEFLFSRLSPGRDALTVDTRINVPKDTVFLEVLNYKNNKPRCFRFLTSLAGKLILRDRDDKRDVGPPLELEKLSEGFPVKGIGFSNAVFETLEPDGEKRLYIAFGAGYERWPRGLACVDPESGKLLWTYSCGAQIHGAVIFKDLDGDRKKEIILSTIAVNNGAEENGTRDDRSYVIVLDSKGNEQWKRKTGSWYTTAQSIVTDLDNDGYPEIVTAVECHRAHYKERGKLFVFAGKSGQEKTPYFSISDASFSPPYAWKTGNKKTRIFVGDSKGRIRMFDGRLNLLKTVEAVKDAPIHVLNMSSEENLFVSTRYEFMAFDRKLEGKLFRYRFQRPPTNILFSRFIPITRQKSSYVFAIGYNVYGIHESEVRVFGILENMVSSGLLALVLILLCFNGFFIYFITLLNASLLLGSRRKRAEEKARIFETVQETAYRLKNPVSTILWTAEKIKRSSENDQEEMDAETYVKLADSLMDDVKTLRRLTNHILAHIQDQKPKDREKGQTGER
jgi:hypothetical protein